MSSGLYLSTRYRTLWPEQCKSPIVDDVRDAATIVSFSGLHCVVCVMLDLRLS